MPRLLGIFEVEDNKANRDALETYAQVEAYRKTVQSEMKEMTRESSTDKEVLCLLQRLGSDTADAE